MNSVLQIKHHDHFVFSAIALSPLGWGLADEKLLAMSHVRTDFQNQIF